jgi:hypothetical protein
LRLRALVVITAFAAAALALASPALAVSEPATPFTGTFTKNPATTDNWRGEIFGAAAPADCGRVNDLNQVGGFVCSVHDTNPQDFGTAEVVVTLDTSLALSTPQTAAAAFRCVDPVETDPITGAPLPLQIDNATCTQVAFRDQAANPNIPQLRLTFPVQGDNPAEPVDTVFYEVRVIPIETGTDIIPYTACAGYIDNGADPCPNDVALNQQPPDQFNTVPASEFLVCSPGDAGNRRFTGSGTVEVGGAKEQQVSISVRQRAETPNRPQGQINHRFFPTKRKFHSKKLACASFHDATKTVEVRGIGWTKVDGQRPRKVCFVSHFQDADYAAGNNQTGKGDNFDITTVPFNRGPDPNSTADDTCGEIGTSPELHNGTLTKGNFRYRINNRGDDCEFDEYDHDNTYNNDNEYDWSH